MDQLQDKILLSNKDAYHIVTFDDILYCKSKNSVTIFYLLNGEEIITSLAIGTLEERLVKHSFVRSHQSYIVNMNHISRIHKNNGIELELTNRCILPVSTRRKSAIMQFIGKIERFQS